MPENTREIITLSHFHGGLEVLEALLEAARVCGIDRELLQLRLASRQLENERQSK
jgi:hypothetical protein